jgi:hypothetical protein
VKTAAPIAVLAIAVSLVGCVRRQMTITSEPAGAMVYLNDREVGRTPLTTDFLWYGTYDVQLRKDGYETLSTRTRVVAPWWGWPPFDLAAEMMPFHPTDHRQFNYVMSERQEEPTSALVARGIEFKSRMSALPATK